jgi:hypothetical protein
VIGRRIDESPQSGGSSRPGYHEHRDDPLGPQRSVTHQLEQLGFKVTGEPPPNARPGPGNFVAPFSYDVGDPESTDEAAMIDLVVHDVRLFPKCPLDGTTATSADLELPGQ